MESHISCGPKIRLLLTPVILLAIVSLHVTCLTSCKNAGSRPQGDRPEQPLSFVMPAIPQELTSNEQRAAYLVAHYWDNFDFANTAYISQTEEVTEQAFVNYIDLFPYAPKEVVGTSIVQMLDKAFARNKKMFDYFAELYEKYLYDHNSPYRNEEYYILALQGITFSQKIDDTRKIRPFSQLARVMKNRTGKTATNLRFTLKNGTHMKLSDIKGQYTILFFNDPDCRDCKQAKELLSQIKNPEVKVAAIYPYDDMTLWQAATYPEGWINGHSLSVSEDELYDLPTIPTIYLLDSAKKVVLKEVTADQIMEYLDSVAR